MIAGAPLADPPRDLAGPCAAVLEVLVGAGSQGLAPRELAARVALPERTRRWAVARLVERGWARREGRRRLWATDAGSRLARRSPSAPAPAPRGTVADLDAATAHLPSEAHRAAFRLLLDAVVARRHRHKAEPSGWPSFVLVGPTKSAKTLLGLGACRVFGLDPALVVRSLPSETERSLWGRRHQLPGGAWVLRPAAVLSAPLLVLDEADKATPDVRRASLRLLQGEARVPGEEGELVSVAPVVVVTANGGAEVVPEEYRRRSVVLDTMPLLDQLGDLHRQAPAFLAALPVLDLDALSVSTAPLLAPIFDDLVRALRAGLSERGWRLVDERGLAHLVAGRAALRGLDVREAVAGVVGDYLTTADTVGETPEAPGPQEPAPDAAERRRAAEARALAEREERRHARATHRELAGRAGQLVHALFSVRPDPAHFDGTWALEAARVRAQVDALIDDVEAAADLHELREVIEDGRPIYDQARALCAHKRPELSRGQVIEAEAEADERWCCNVCGHRFTDAESMAVYPDADDWQCPSCGSLDVDEASASKPARLPVSATDLLRQVADTQASLPGARVTCPCGYADPCPLPGCRHPLLGQPAQVGAAPPGVAYRAEDTSIPTGAERAIVALARLLTVLPHLATSARLDPVATPDPPNDAPSDAHLVGEQPR